MRSLLRQLFYLGRRGRFDAELDKEVEFHIQTRAEELQEAGLTPAAALAQARREFGSGARMREESRAAWQWRWVEDLFADLRYAARSLRRNPGFAITAIACLTLGIGANTTMFSITKEVLFSRPSVRAPETMVHMEIGGNSHAPIREFRFLRDSHFFEALAGENEEQEVNWRHAGATERLHGVRVSDNFFAVTGIPVALGRPIQAGEETAAVLSHDLWERRMGADPAVVGGTMVLDGRVYTIAGVLPRDHRTLLGFGFAPDLYLTVPGEGGLLALFARLPDGMTRHVAIEKLRAACAALDRAYPDPDHKWVENIRVSAVAGVARVRGDEKVMVVAAFFGVLMVVVGLVLGIACANVASLLLARASSRSQELAIRLSIGAGRGRLVRQLLAESLLLALAGMAGGLGVNVALTAFLSRIRLPLPLPFQFLIEPDWTLLAYAGAVALGTCLVAGLLPAIQSVRSALQAALSRHEPRSRTRLRNALVAGQLAVSTVLLCAGLLFLRNLMQSYRMSPGFDVAQTMWSQMRVVPEAYKEPAKLRALAEAGLERVRGLPGVESAALARVVPLNINLRMGVSVRTDVSGRPVHIQYNLNYVTPDYFRTMGIPLVRGREFLAADRAGAPAVVIVNETVARALFGQTDPIGHYIRFDWGPSQVVGVARNSKYFTLGEESAMAIYEPYSRMSEHRADVQFLIRSKGRPEGLTAAVNAALGRLDPTAALETKPMSQALVFALLPSRFGGAVLGSMGLLGLGLASIGLYGVLLYSVSRRTREIGVRVAIGASPRNVLWLVLRHSFGLVGVGLAIGIALGVLAVKPLALFLIPEVNASGAGNFLVVGASMCAIALLATLSPVVRALRVDPVAALRQE